jgi:ubiquinone/menaquinone biosynthesis C-methylase UbiE
MKNAFCVPQGMVGRLGGGLMALDDVLPAWVLDKLQIGPSDSVLEVGPGPGVGVELVAAKVPQGRVVGIDPSETMLTMARRRNRDAIKAGRVELCHGTVSNLPFDDATFDAAFTINTLHLWPDAVAGLAEVRRTLRPGRPLAVALSRFSYAFSDSFARHLIDAGFADVSVHQGDRGTCFLGRATPTAGTSPFA